MMEIGNIVGYFIYMDPRVFGAWDKQVTSILVEVNYLGNLPDNIDLAWDSICI